MTQAQWLFEAHGLRKKEERETKDRSEFASVVYRESVRALRETLIYLFGLNIGAGKPKKDEDSGAKKGDDVAGTPFIPFMLTMGRGEVLEELIARDAEERMTENALEDERIDDLNVQLSKLEMGDLEPLIFSGKNSNDPFERWRSPEHQRFLRDVGVDIVSDENTARQQAEDELLLGRDPTTRAQKPVKGAMKPR